MSVGCQEIDQLMKMGMIAWQEREVTLSSEYGRHYCVNLYFWYDSNTECRNVLHHDRKKICCEFPADCSREKVWWTPSPLQLAVP